MERLSVLVHLIVISVLAGGIAGCDSLGFGDESAQVIGTIEHQGAVDKTEHCPEALFTVNGQSADVDYMDDAECSFEIDDVPVEDEVTFGVDLPSEGLSAEIGIRNVHNDELIELGIDYDDDSINIEIERRISDARDDDNGREDDQDDDDNGDDDGNGYDDNRDDDDDDYDYDDVGYRADG